MGLRPGDAGRQRPFEAESFTPGTLQPRRGPPMPWPGRRPRPPSDSRRLPSDPIQPENRRAMALDSLRELLPVVTPLLGAALACAADKSDDTNPTLQRERMVAQQIEARGVKDARTLAAMRKVPRHLFVPAA